MKNKYYLVQDINANCKYYFIMQSRGMGKALYEQKELKERVNNEKRILFTKKD